MLIRGQKSVPVALQGGRTYYVEALHSEWDAGDHMEVAWQIPGALKPTIIAGQFLSPWLVDPTPKTGPPEANGSGESARSGPPSRSGD